jgi:CHASE3 domain sensor protein
MDYPRKQKEGVNVMIRKTALQIAALGLLGLIVFNAYLAIHHSKQLQASAALSLETYGAQVNIDQIRQDFTDMETGQRGYLLTDDPAYLQPYAAAKENIGKHLTSLRSAMADRPESERSLEAQLESLAASKQAEIERTITLRQQGYRHRAFLLVQSNEGRDYMNRVRELASSLTSTESSRFAALENDRNANARKAMSEIILANLGLLVLTIGLFVLTRFHERRLEEEAARNRRTLMQRDSELEKLTSSLADQGRVSIEIIEENARLLLDRYAGFLPPQGYECAKQIGEAAAQVEQLRRELLGHTDVDLGQNAA